MGWGGRGINYIGTGSGVFKYDYRHTQSIVSKRCCVQTAASIRRDGERGGECVTAAYSQGAGADLEKKKKDKPKIKHSSGVRGVGVGYLVNLFKLTIISTHLAGIR